MTSIPVRWPDGRITHETIGQAIEQQITVGAVVLGIVGQGL